MDRRLFFGRSAAALAGALLTAKVLPAVPVQKLDDDFPFPQSDDVPYFGKPIARILDSPEQVFAGEYFFAHSQSQQGELAEAVRAAARAGQQVYFENDHYRPPKYGAAGVLIFSHHGGGAPSVPRVNFCSVVLLPETIGHPAFDAIRAKAEMWP